MDITKASRLNALQDSSYKLNILELPNVVMFCQSLTLPGLSLGEALFATPNVDVKVPGDKVIFDHFDVEFLVDEHLLNYKEIWNWMIHLGFPMTTEQFKILNEGNTQYKEVSDLGVMLTTNKLNANLKMSFIDAFPVTLSPLTMTSVNSDTDYLTATVSFAYSYYYFGQHNDTY